jgi:CRP/FNR family transcriptional regulator, cyclic AMP receptor protein
LSTAQLGHTAFNPLELRPDLRRCWDGTLPMELERGDYLYLPGDPARSVFLMRSGSVRLGRLLDSGGELSLDVVGPGELLGEDAALGAPRRLGLAQALEKVRVSPLPVPVMEAALARSPDLAVALARISVERRRRLEDRAVESAFGDCRRRLSRLLLDLADRFGTQDVDGRRIAVRLTHEDLARFIGAARETVTPLLVQLRNEGTIDYDRRRIVIRDSQGLRRPAP